MITLVALSFVLSAMICGLVLRTKPWHIVFTAKGHTSTAKQSSHRVPTPRIGGLGIVSFLAIGAVYADIESSRVIILLGMSALPVFIGGLGEDTGFDVSPKMRLLLSFVSAAIAGVLLNAWVSRSGIPFLDTALTFTLFSIAFTMLISGGICHALNLVDGLNGLSIGLSIITAGAFAVIATFVGDTTMATVSLLLIGALGGIFVFNYPFGKIFLGDAGAYTVGHLLTWIAVLLMTRNPEIAPFAMFLVFFWPIADMLFSIMRRVRNGKPIDQPDRMHFHQFVMRAIELTVVNRRSMSNPIAATIIWLLAMLPITLAITFYDANLIALLSWIVCFTLFVWSYVTGIRIARHLSRARKNNERLTATIQREGFGNMRRAASSQRKVYPAE